VLVLPGVVADRREKRIELLAEATGLGPGEIVEFGLIDATSCKGYEALFWSHARGSHVQRALEFIGLEPGEPFDPAGLRFWPKGERVIARVAAWDIEDGHAEPVRLERLIVNERTGRTLPERGFVFVGSPAVEPPRGQQQPTAAGDRASPATRAGAHPADVMEPKSILSIYNSPITVLDVPARAPQHAVYGTQVVGPAYCFAAHELVRVVLEPEHKDGRHRVVELELRIRPDRHIEAASAQAGQRAGPAAGVEFVLTDRQAMPACAERHLVAVVGVFERLVRQGCDPFVTVRFDPELSLHRVREVCRLLAAIDTEQGIHVEPPPPGELYYQALLPDAALLDPEKRVIDPWELHLTKADPDAAQGGGTATGPLAARLVRHESSYASRTAKRACHTVAYEIRSPAELLGRLRAEAQQRAASGRRSAPPVLLVFASGDVTYGQLMELLRPVQPTHHVIHVFLQTEPNR